LLQAIEAFLTKHQMPELRLLLVVNDHGIGDALRGRLQQSDELVSSRCTVLERDPLHALTTLSSIGSPCRFVASETNWRFNSTATLIGKAIFAAAGNALLHDTKKKFSTAECGRAYAVQLSTVSQLTDQEVQWVIHVNPPNRNPKKPDVISDAELLSELLASSYTELFSTFYELLAVA
jgi:hypothetical protein